MQTITIDIINEKAIFLLKDLELLKLIRLRKGHSEEKNIDWTSYKGAMSKQAISDVDRQLNDLRNEWE